MSVYCSYNTNTCPSAAFNRVCITVIITVVINQNTVLTSNVSASNEAQQSLKVIQYAKPGDAARNCSGSGFRRGSWEGNKAAHESVSRHAQLGKKEKQLLSLPLLSRVRS